MKQWMAVTLLAMLVACQGAGPSEAPKETALSAQAKVAAAMKAAAKAGRLVLVDVYSDT